MYIKRISAAIIFIFVIIAVICRENIIKLSEYFPKCWFYENTGRLCPACGNTRSVIALFHGNIFISIGYNIIPTVLLVIGIIFYAELITACCGHHIKIFPRSYIFLGVLLSLICIYFILRNIIPFLTIC